MQPDLHDPTDADLKHLRWLVLGHRLLAALGALAGLLCLGLAYVATRHPVLRGHAATFACLALVCFAYGALYLWVGAALARRRKRTFCIVMSALNCAGFPGILVGLPTILVLIRPQVAHLFEPERRP